MRVTRLATSEWGSIHWAIRNIRNLPLLHISGKVAIQSRLYASNPSRDYKEIIPKPLRTRSSICTAGISRLLPVTVRSTPVLTYSPVSVYSRCSARSFIEQFSRVESVDSMDWYNGTLAMHLFCPKPTECPYLAPLL